MRERTLMLGGLYELVALGVMSACAGTSVTVQGNATEGGELIRQAAERQPDVVLADASLIDEAMVARLAPAQVLILGEYADVDYLALLRSGLRGFVSRAMAPDDLPQIVESAVTGGVVLSPALQAALAERSISEGDGPGSSPHVTPRQREILSLVAGGLRDREMAKELNLSLTTIKTHLQRVNEALDTRTRAHAACRALRLGLLDLPREPGG